MNTEVVFYFSLPASIFLTVIKEMKSTRKGRLFGSFSSRLNCVMEWKMTRQFNYRHTIVSPLYKYWFWPLSASSNFCPPIVCVPFCCCRSCTCAGYHTVLASTLSFHLFYLATKIQCWLFSVPKATATGLMVLSVLPSPSCCVGYYFTQGRRSCHSPCLSLCLSVC